jgi:hypothetical protein
VDYTVDVTSAVNAGAYTLTVNGIGNYIGSMEHTWHISMRVVTFEVMSNTIAMNETVPAVAVDVRTSGDDMTAEEIVAALQMTASWNVPATLVPGTYNATVNYVPDANFTVTVLNTKVLTVTPGVNVAKNVQTGAYYKTVSEALMMAQPGQTVQLVVEEATDNYVIIPTGVTLDLQANTLNANYVVGFNGSYLTATPESAAGVGGVLNVGVKNIVLSQQAPKSGNNYVMPIYNGNHFVFSLFNLNVDASVTEKYEGHFYVEFGHLATGNINRTLLNDGASDNEIAIIIRLTYTTASGYVVNQDCVYTDQMVTNGAKGQGYSFKISLEGRTNMTVTPMILTNSGVAVVGTSFNPS